MTRIRKSRRIALIAALLALLPLRAKAQAAPEQEPPPVSAAAAVLLDRASGRVLYEKNPDQPMQAASTTKIMTALLVLESCRMEDQVKIRAEWTRTEGSSMYLRAGETYTVGELLYGLMLASGNDAAVALACHAAGDEAAFVARMNQRAADLCMTGTRFVDPNGLRSEGHSATARDMAVLAREAMENPEFAALVATKTAVVAGQSLRNHNKLLWQYPGAVGVKTGYTRAAGRALVSCAEREGGSYICVTFSAPNDWADHAALLDWAYSRYETVDVSSLSWTVPVISGTADSVTVRPAASCRLLAEKGAPLRQEVSLPGFLYAPLTAGEEVGRLRLLAEDGTERASVPLVCESAVPLDGTEPLTLWEKLRRAWFFACRHGGIQPNMGLLY